MLDYLVPLLLIVVCVQLGIITMKLEAVARILQSGPRRGAG